MRRDLLTSLIAVVFLTVVFGLAYPLAFTGVAQVLFPGKADGSKITENGQVVGSKLIAQKLHQQDGKPDPATSSRAPRRPATTRPSPSSATSAPTAATREHEVKANLARLPEARGPLRPGPDRGGRPGRRDHPVGVGVDPQISEANARIQAHRIAAVRHLPLVSGRRSLIDDHTDGRFLGLFGEPGVNVLELNLALDKEAPAA